MARPGRNDPCPCGSGAKYKRCCLARAEKPAQAAPSLAEAAGHLAAGRLAEAERLCRAALATPALSAEAQCRLGDIARQRGDTAGAAERYRLAAEADPREPAYRNSLGVTLRGLGRPAEALAAYDAALALEPGFAEAHNNRGNALKDLGRAAEAEAAYRAAVAAAPGYALGRMNLGLLLLDRNQPREAVEHLRAALELNPALPQGHARLAGALHALGRLPEAVQACRQALEREPRDLGSARRLADILRQMGRPAQAVEAFRAALALDPAQHQAHVHMGNALAELGRLDEAADCYRRALALRPDLAEARCNLGNALSELGRLDEAETCLRQALAQLPDMPEIHTNLGNVLKALGRLDEALACCREAVRLRPDWLPGHSNLLFTLNAAPGGQWDERMEAARRFGLMASRAAVAPLSSWRCDPAARPLRVGLVSGDLRRHPVGLFLEGVLPRLSAHGIELFAYPTSPLADDLTARLRPLFAAWRPLPGLGDAEASRMIAADGVHLLLDLAGHTSLNRLPLFAWRPAPVQASWLGYFATTGVSEMDYLLADEAGAPEGSEVQFTEQLWRLPETRLCFSPPLEAGEVAPLPALAGAPFTFGCFQNLTKAGDAVLDLWARILSELPQARLRFQCRQLRDPGVARRFALRLGERGIDPGRALLLPDTLRDAYLAAHAEVDLILDTFPYPGGTTTCEALWMGVPTLTLAGEGLLARQGVGLLAAAGLPEFIARDPDEYVRKAVALAGDLPALAALRRELRGRVGASPLFDGERFAASLAAALRGMWERAGAPRLAQDNGPRYYRLL